MIKVHTLPLKDFVGSRVKGEDILPDTPEKVVQDTVEGLRRDSRHHSYL